MKNHCQICAREIKANTGTIAHHGYQRPGNGWQTASCMGAKYLPYEQSRDRIPAVIEAYKGIRQNNLDRAEELMTNPPATLTRYARYGFQENQTFNKPADFHPETNLQKGSFGYQEGYQMEHRSIVKECRKNAASIEQEIEWLQNRYDTWEAK